MSHSNETVQESVTETQDQNTTETQLPSPYFSAVIAMTCTAVMLIM